MKIQYKLVTIKIKIAILGERKSPLIYKELIKWFRACQDSGIIEVKNFDSREVEKEIEE